MRGNEIDPRLVGERISARMRELGMSQKDVYDITEFSKTTMSNYVNGRRLPSTIELYQLAKVLKVSMEWLLAGEDFTTNENHNFTSEQLPHIDYEFLLKFYQLSEKEKGRIEERIDIYLSDRAAHANETVGESSTSKNGKEREDAATRAG